MVNLNKPDAVALVVEAVKNSRGTNDLGLGDRLHYHAENVPLPTGQADLLLLDSDNNTLYVVAILAGEALAEDVGELLGHCGCLKTLLVNGCGSVEADEGVFNEPYPVVFPHITEVRGIILARDFSSGAVYSLAGCHALISRTYRFSIELSEIGKHPCYRKARTTISAT